MTAVALFFPNSEWLRRGNSMLRWRGVAGEVEEYCGPDGCQGDVMLHEPHVRIIAEQFRGCSRRIEMKGSAVEYRIPKHAAILGPRGL